MLKSMLRRIGGLEIIKESIDLTAVQAALM